MTTESHWSAESPEAVIEQAFRAFRSRDGLRLAAVASAASLQHYRERVRAELHPTWQIWTPEELRAHDPSMPKDVAEWRVKELERDRARHEERLLAPFVDVRSVDELEQMSAAELLSRALRAAPQEAIALGGCRILGHVQEGEDRAYVLFWLGVDLEPVIFEEPQVAVLERSDSGWRLVLDPFARWGVPGFRNIGFGGYAS